MENKQVLKLNNIFKNYPEIKLAYFFGSRAEENYNDLSDYDFAVYLDEQDKIKMYDIKFELMAKIGKLFKTDKIDVVVLNLAKNSELKYNIIKDGKLIYEKEPYKVLVEPRILNEYFDFVYLLRKYNLTKA